MSHAGAPGHHDASRNAVARSSMRRRVSPAGGPHTLIEGGMAYGVLSMDSFGFGLVANAQEAAA